MNKHNKSVLSAKHPAKPETEIVRDVRKIKQLKKSQQLASIDYVILNTDDENYSAALRAYKDSIE